MRFGINAGFGEVISHEVPELLEHRFTDIRQDLHHITDTNQMQTVLRDCRETDMTPLWICRGNQLNAIREDERAELLNEPNLTGWTPERYAQEWNQYAPAALERGVILYGMSVSNLNRECLQFVKTAYALMNVKPTHVSVHRYPNDKGLTDPIKGYQTPHKGFRNREEEVDALRQIIGGATIAVTEFGYHTAGRKKWEFFKIRWSDSDVATMVYLEWQFWKSQNVDSAYIYQLNDAADSNSWEQFGMRDQPSGAHKPVYTAHYSLTRS